MRTYVDALHVGAGTQLGPITTFPVWTTATAVPGLRAPGPASVAITELAEPRVEALAVTNSGPDPVLLAEGTLLLGGWQTRVLARDAVITPRERIQVETTCVEAGRWGGGTDHSLSGRAPVRVIGELRGVRRPVHERLDRRHRQARVWDQVTEYEGTYGRGPTSSLADLMEDDNDMPVRSAWRRLKAQLGAHAQSRLPGQSGIVIGILGQPVMLEVFPSVRLFAHHLPGLLRGLALDVVNVPIEPTPARRARRFAERLMGAPLQAMEQIPGGTIYAASQGYLDVRALDARAGDREGSAHILAINSKHDLVLAA